MTLIGGDGPLADKKQGGMHLRRGTAGKVNNAIVAFWNQFGADIDGAQSVAQFGIGLTITNTYFVKSTSAAAVWPAGFDVSNNVENDGGFDEVAMIGSDATNKVDIDVQLTDAEEHHDAELQAGRGLARADRLRHAAAGLDVTATFCGAIGADDWTAGWTAYPN